MIRIEYQSKRVKSTFGGSRVEVTYTMRHEERGRVNRYTVNCEIVGIESLRPHLHVQDVEFLGNMETESNDETLKSEAAQELFEGEL